LMYGMNDSVCLLYCGMLVPKSELMWRHPVIRL
jgi:hypothetical protein